MQEVVSKLQFNQPCLGNVRKKDRNEMLKDPMGRVMILPTWWQALATFAARLHNRHQDKVKEIDWDPIVEGCVKDFRRYYAPGKFTVHEAFLPGDVIRVRAVLPDGISPQDFQEILVIAGRYKGICPFKPERKMGTFEVLEVRALGRPPATTPVASLGD
jgi:hypothetical protein